MSFLKNVMIFFISMISAFFRLLGLRACRFAPSCSAYSIDAFHRHGFGKAFLFTVTRLFRCHPFSAGGYDPVK